MNGWILTLAWVISGPTAQATQIVREPPQAYADEAACNKARDALLRQQQPAGVGVLVACKPAS